jgi:23S rRNA pseudouridine2604 synthase
MNAPNRPAAARAPQRPPAPVRATPAPGGATGTGERLSKRVMQIQSCSRREAEQYIEGGCVAVNGVVVEDPAHRVGSQSVVVDPTASLMLLAPVTLVLHKPPDMLLESACSLLTPAQHFSGDACGIRVLKRHFKHLQTVVPLETGASGLVVFTQDWRIQRKLTEDLGAMENELIAEVRGDLSDQVLQRLNRESDTRGQRLPVAKVSINSTAANLSKLRFAVKGAHPGLVAYLCGLAGLELLGIRRIRLGRVALSDLPVGSWRYLARHEKF